MIYLAPLQGFTDFVYRKAYSQVFTDVDAFFVPYISTKNDSIPSKYVKEVLPDNNLQTRVVPQILAENAREMQMMSEFLANYDYKELNLNLGCPYPMVTNRGKGSGLLPAPEKVRSILSAFFETQNPKLSVKLRAGLHSEKEIEQIIPVLNEFPLSEVILHPRIAKQLYAGNIFDEAVVFVSKLLKHKLVYNGDINTLADYERRKKQFSTIDDWMLGRGILMNPFLAAEIAGRTFSEDEKHDKLRKFHQLMLETYLEVMDNEGNALNKMKQFWVYFSFNFPNQRKAFKAIKKSNNMLKFKTEVKKIFAQL